MLSKRLQFNKQYKFPTLTNVKPRDVLYYFLRNKMQVVTFNLQHYQYKQPLNFQKPALAYIKRQGRKDTSPIFFLVLLVTIVTIYICLFMEDCSRPSTDVIRD